MPNVAAPMGFQEQATLFLQMLNTLENVGACTYAFHDLGVALGFVEPHYEYRDGYHG